MYPVSPGFLAALRGPHTALARVGVWRAGVQLIPDLAFSAGLVTVDGTQSGVRRKLDLTTARDGVSALWDLLAPVGTELVPYRGVRFPNGSTEWVPLGVFPVDAQAMSYAVEGTITLTAPDRWALVQRARFLQPVTTSGQASLEALRLAQGAVATTAASSITSTATTRRQVWDRDRDQAINDLARSVAGEVFFAVDGSILARDIPRLTGAPVWSVDSGPRGVLTAASRARDRSRTYNVVVVVDESTDGSVPFAPQIAYDDVPSSPTYTGGPFGQVPVFYSSPLLTTAAQAMAAARAILSRTTGLAAQLTLEGVVNPALDAGDVITVRLPDGRTELHLLDTVTIPLDTVTAQQMGTRSTRPEGDVPT